MTKQDSSKRKPNRPYPEFLLFTTCNGRWYYKLQFKNFVSFFVLTFSCALTFTGITEAQTAPQPHEYVPHHLLGLIHAPEVHRELKMTQGQINQLEKLFDQIDGQWWRSRNLKVGEKTAVILKLEETVDNWLQTNCTAEQRLRLQQLELRSQGTRMLLRTDVQEKLSLSELQVRSIFELAQATQNAQTELQKAIRQNLPTEELRGAVSKAQEAEQKVFLTLLKSDQIAKLRELAGREFDTSGLKRIFPKAPELIASKHWINTKPLTLANLRGKVVLLHFYAFQCHNCKANFDVYRRWHEKFGDQVVLIGIQTPETALERDPVAVARAAGNEELTFPILIDLEAANWKNWSNTMWPTVYVIDKQGYLRQWWQGELRWQGATGDQAIEKLVEELILESS